MEDRLLQQWKDIEDLEAEEPEDKFKAKKEQWFLQAFAFLRDLPDESHCWCGHKEIMQPLLEPFYGYFHETSPNTPLKVLWRRLSKEMRACTRCVVQHHKAKDFYVSEFVEEVVKPLLDIVRALDEERVAGHIKELVHKFNMDTLDPKEDSRAVISVMFEVLMYPFLLDDAEINDTVGLFLLHVEETHDLSLAAGQRYPGVYSLLLHKDQGVRRIAGKLTQSLPTFKDEHEMESIQPMLGMCMNCLEYDSFDSTLYAKHGRPRASFTREALWIGLTTLLNLLEPPAFLKGVMEKYPTFVSIVLNHISEVTPVFWNALRCLKLLLQVLGYKLWLGTTFSPGVMRNTLLSQCFHSREERLHVHIFDLFEPFLTSLEALQDGEYENQRRRLLYFLLQQVPLSSNFKPLITKKACQVAFSIIGRGYTMDPPLPPVECVHFWGPPLVATLKDTSLIPSVKQSATDLIQSIIVADAAALAAVFMRQASAVQNFDNYYSLGGNDNDEDETAEEASDKARNGLDSKCWVSFLAVTRSVEASEQWFCLPLLWLDVLNGIMPRNLPSSFTKGIMWALSRLSMIDLEGLATPKDLVVTSIDEVSCSRDLFVAFMWVKPKGCEDGASGVGCVNAVKTAAHCDELVGLFKKCAEKYLSRLRDAGIEHGDWAWEARMAEPCILLPLDANAAFREFGKDVLRRVSNCSTLEGGLELLSSSEASCVAVSRGLHHALKQLLHWPLNRCSRGLQQLFFHVWKLLTLGDKEQPERHASQSQGSRDGGFLSQPNFQSPSLNNTQSPPVNNGGKDDASWKKLCTQVACQLWPLLVKTIMEGREHLEGAGQLMTFTRMLQLLPCVFRNLNSTQKKKSFSGRKAIKRQDSSDLTWFGAFVGWSDVASPIIQRWWKEAVASILEDLKGWEVDLPLELEDLILDLRKPGLELDQQRRLSLTTLLRSVPSLVLSNQFLDRETKADTLKRENAPHHNEVIDLMDSPEASPSARVHRLNLHDDDPSSTFQKEAFDSFVKVSVPHIDVIDLPDSPEASAAATVQRLDLHGDDSLSTLRKKQQDESDSNDATSNRKYNVSDEGRGSLSNTYEKRQFDWPHRTQVHRPSSQKGTLDDYLAKFFTNKAEKETKKGGFQVQQQVRSNASKPPAPSKSVPGKFQKAGGKLSSLRSEHREALEERSAVAGIVRNQVRERVEREARAKQLAPVEQNQMKVSAPESLVPSGIPRGVDAELREVVRDDEVDPLDAALDTVRKPRLQLAEPVLKPRRKLITLEMPGESGRGGSLGKPKPGLVINPRQIPRLDPWYKQILSLDYLSVVGISDENSSFGTASRERLEKVPLTFNSPAQYMNIFRPLVLEEFKSQLQQSHGEMNLSDASTTGILRLMSLERVDDLQVGRFVAEAGSDGAARSCADNEVILLSRQPLQSASQSCHLLAKMESRDKESKTRGIVLLLKLYVPAGVDVRLSKAKRLLVDRSKWYMTRIMNITPQIREWQALSSLQSLPLLPVLLSPAAGSKMKSLESVSSIAKLRCLPEQLQSKLRGDYNESQLRAIADSIGGKETMTNDHQLTLVQGPPGTGKTKTIVAILSALLALRSSKRTPTAAGTENQPPTSRSNVGMGGFNNSIKSSSRDAAAMSRAWQDAARAKEMMKESEKYSPDLQGQKQRILVCAQSNAAVDEIVARICKNGLYGVDGQFFKPVVVRVGTLKSVHPRSLPVYIDTLVDQRLGISTEKENVTEPAEDTEQTKLVASRSKLEEVIEFIQVIESLRSQSKDVEGEKNEQKAGVSESVWTEKALKVIAMGESAVTGKLNLLYSQRRALTAEVATAEKEGRKSYEESKNMRKSIKRDIIRQADVVVTTLSGCGGDIYSVCMESVVGGNKKNKSVQECFFDAVVIDEAAQALEPATLIPLQLLVQTNARCVMVGDPKQLPATVLSQTASRMQYECSMFERLQRAGFPVTMLSTQYRMHPEIRQFPSAHFYDDLITDGEGLNAARKAIFHREPSFGPYVFFNVVDGQESSKGSSASQSLSNQAEVSVAVHLYLALKKGYPAELWDGRVGIITPYKQQLRLLQEEFGRALGSAAASDIEFNTVDGFQGREVDILILTTVRASSFSSENSSKQAGGIGFVADVRRMNVALTRARFSLWIIGNAATLKANSSWASLVSNAERRDVIYSVQKPYGSFFQKRRYLVESSQSSRAHKTSWVREDDRQPNGDLCRPAAGEAAPGRPKEIREREEPKGVVVRKGGGRSLDHTSRERTAGSSLENRKAIEVRGLSAHQSNEHSRDRHGRSSETKRNDEGQVVSRASSRHGHEGGGSRTESRRNPPGEDPSRELSRNTSGVDQSRENSRRNQTREDQSRECGRDRHGDRRSTTEIKRNRATGHDKGRAEDVPGRERNSGEDELGKRLHQDDGRSGNKEKSEPRSQLEKEQNGSRNGEEARTKVSMSAREAAEMKQHERNSGRKHELKETSGNDREVVVEAMKEGRSQPSINGGGAKYMDGPAGDEKIGFRRRPEKEFHVTDQISVRNSNRSTEEQNVSLGETRDGVDKSHQRSREERSHGGDHRLDEKGAARGQESTHGRQRNISINAKHIIERKQPATDERMVCKQAQVSPRENRMRRTSQEEMMAARKRKREQVDALLPSSLSKSSDRSRASFTQDQKSSSSGNCMSNSEIRPRYSKVEATRPKAEQKVINEEWAKFEAALVKSKPEPPVASKGPADSATRASSKASGIPGRELKRPAPAPKQSNKPASDLDSILAGLSSVTRAQAKAGKMDAPPKSRM
ncbi:unnamed protein product [Calypogeia fissa]